MLKKARDLHVGDKVWDVEDGFTYEVAEVFFPATLDEVNVEPGDELVKIIFKTPIKGGLGKDRRAALLPGNIDVRMAIA